MASRCRHTAVPVGLQDRRIRVRCTACGKKWLRASDPSPNCDRASRDHQRARQAFAAEYMAASDEDKARMGQPPAFTAGCDQVEGCFQGRVLAKRSQCCCRMDVTKCEGCRNATSSTHICLRMSPEEADQALALAMMGPVKTRAPLSQKMRDKMASLEQGQGIRAPKYPD